MRRVLSLEDRPRLARKAMLRHDAVRGADLLLLPERVVKLNPTGGAILRRCDGSRTVIEIARELETEFEHTNLAPQVQAFLNRIAEQGALEP